MAVIPKLKQTNKKAMLHTYIHTHNEMLLIYIERYMLSGILKYMMTLLIFT